MQHHVGYKLCIYIHRSTIHYSSHYSLNVQYELRKYYFIITIDGWTLLVMPNFSWLCDNPGRLVLQLSTLVWRHRLGTCIV